MTLSGASAALRVEGRGKKKESRATVPHGGGVAQDWLILSHSIAGDLTRATREGRPRSLTLGRTACLRQAPVSKSTTAPT